MTPTPAETPAVRQAGRLEGIGLPELLWGLCRRSCTGVLHVLRDPIRRDLYIRDGRIVFAASSDPNDRLGEMLLRQGTITLDQLEAALAQLRSGKRLGTLLVESGGLTSEQLVAAVVGQVKAIVLDLLSWEHGAYRFDEGPLPIDEVITLQMRTADLLLEGTRRVATLERVRQSVGPGHALYRLSETAAAEDPGPDPGLNDGERLLLERLRQGPRSVETLCRELELSSFEVLRSLWAFRVLGLAAPSEEPADSAGELRGRLEHTPLTELLLGFAERAETGVLHLHGRGVERQLHLRDGRCVFATSTDPDDGLIADLFRRGVISLRDQEEVGRRLLTNRRVGAILRELGVIDDQDLKQAIRRQVQEIVYSSFAWHTGQFVFLRGPLPTIEDVPLELEMAALIPEGLRRIDSWTRVVRGCGGIDQPLTLAPDYLARLDAMDAGVDEWKVVNALTSAQSPRRVCRLVEDLPDFEVCRILWTLKLLGAVVSRPAEELEAGAEQPVETQEVAAALLELSGRAQDGDGEPEPVGGPVTAGDEAAEPTALVEVVPEPEEEPSELDRVIQRFNAMHRVIYQVVRTEIGAGASNFVRSCHLQVASASGDALEGVELHGDGTWDEPALKRVARTKQLEDPWPSYQALLDREYLQLKPHLGDAKALELKQRIWQLHSAQNPEDGSQSSSSSSSGP